MSDSAANQERPDAQELELRAWRYEVALPKPHSQPSRSKPASVPPNSRTSAPRPTKTEARPVRPPSSRHRRGWYRAAPTGGGCLIGLVALIGGLLLHSHYEPIRQVCASGIGALGQALDAAAQQQCSTASLLAEGGMIAAVFGGIILAGSALVLIGVLGDIWLARRS